MLADIAEFAETLPNHTRPLIRRWFRQQPEIRQKSDTSPVTEADEAVEAALRQAITQQFPDHAIRGEEIADKTAAHASRYVWVIDPIDGTRAFATGNPLFGTLIGVVEGEVPKIGVIDLPMCDQCWIGVGEVTRCNGDPVTSHKVTDLSQARLATTSAAFLGDNGMARFAGLAEKCRVVNYGGDCANYGYLASGWCDVVAEAQLSPHDIMAVVPVILGAGGCISQWDGKPIRLNAFDGTVLASPTQALHTQALAILQHPQPHA